eukprot:1948101-Pleurochrysis_carterae.AAC.1
MAHASTEVYKIDTAENVAYVFTTSLPANVDHTQVNAARNVRARRDRGDAAPQSLSDQYEMHVA